MFNHNTGVGYVAGLAQHSASSTLYWADGALLRVFAATVDRESGVANTPATLQEIVSYVAMPTALALELANAHSLGADRLYLLDQKTPMKLTRTWLNGANRSTTQTLVQYGLSRPRAVGLSSANGSTMPAASTPRSHARQSACGHSCRSSSSSPSQPPPQTAQLRAPRLTGEQR